ncbi:hypothetical protein ACQPW1_45145 [Nocardia sp. CA-128927]|uniref:hypothetical protein n=1 Tax=Nocardia sp. CA-128927 TaxID=3239975 RepID=UPI003D979304
MRIARSIPVAVATIALALSVGACGDKSSDTASTTTPAAQPSTTQPQPSSAAQPITTQPQSSPGPAADAPVDCGSRGLEIFAFTTKGTGACTTAIEVTINYEKKPAAPGTTVTFVVGDGSTWTCQQRQGQVNPYIECVDKNHPAEKVRLVS